MTKAAKITRGGSKTKPKKARAAKAKAKKPGILAELLELVPVRKQTIERAMTIGLTSLVAIALIGVAVFAGVPQFVGVQIAQAVGRAGFQVKRIEVVGIDRMEQLAVYAIATDQHSMAMPLVDLDKVRNQLLKFGWIEEAKVYRRLPDTLVVDITERKPSAIWQHNQKLSLIDGKGVVLETVNPDAMPDLPLLIGSKANRKAIALNALLERAPALKPDLAAATWIGNRRWDLQFESGETLALPEGEEAAAKALLHFARLEGVQRLLGRGFVRFDMRDPGRFVARVNRNKPAETEKPADKPDNEGPAIMRENDNGPA